MKVKKIFGWCLIPPSIFCRKDLSQSQKLLIGRITGLITADGYCFASNKWLGEQIGLTKGTTANILSDLQNKNIIKIELIRDEKQRIIERRIYPVFGCTTDEKSDIPIHEKMNTYSRKNEYPIHEKMKGSNRDKRNRERDKDTLSESDESLMKNFLLFWKEYPKKRAKNDAFKAFCKIQPDEQTMAVMLAAVGQAKTTDEWRREKGRYIPYPATWLNGRRWEDEIGEVCRHEQAGSSLSRNSTRINELKKLSQEELYEHRLAYLRNIRKGNEQAGGSISHSAAEQ